MKQIVHVSVPFSYAFREVSKREREGERKRGSVLWTFNLSLLLLSSSLCDSALAQVFALTVFMRLNANIFKQIIAFHHCQYHWLELPLNMMKCMVLPVKQEKPTCINCKVRRNENIFANMSCNKLISYLNYSPIWLSEEVPVFLFQPTQENGVDCHMGAGLSL